MAKESVDKVLKTYVAHPLAGMEEHLGKLVWREVDLCLGRLEGWAQSVRPRQRNWRLISTSLLIVYEGACCVDRVQPQDACSAVRSEDVYASQPDSCNGVLEGSHQLERRRATAMIDTSSCYGDGSSILKLEEEHKCQAVVRCALIDFAHCFFGELGIDDNFARGAAAFRAAAARVWGQEP
jgi:hypothetical protein